MNKFKVAEAIALAKENGIKLSKGHLAEKLWPGSTKMSQTRNMSLLLQGVTKRLTVDMIRIICDETGVDPNFLIDYGTDNQ